MGEIIFEKSYKTRPQRELNGFYKKHAHIYDSVRSPIIDSFEEKIEILKKKGRITQKARIVEIGVGTGKYLKKIVKDTRCEGIGIDISYEMLLAAQKTKSEKINYIKADAIKIPLPSNYCDLVYAVNTVHQIADKYALFCESFRILKEEGKIIIISPDINRLRDFLLYKVCPFLFKFEKERLPNMSELVKYGVKSGFTLLEHFLSPMNDNSIPLEDFLFCIEHRFLSCLSSLSNEKIKEVIQKIKSFSACNNITKVFPYSYITVVFEKK